MHLYCMCRAGYVYSSLWLYYSTADGLHLGHYELDYVDLYVTNQDCNLVHKMMILCALPDTLTKFSKSSEPL